MFNIKLFDLEWASWCSLCGGRWLWAALKMASPFLLIPETAWVASNDLAFAFRDRYPVSPGHTLIVTRREIPTCFDLSAEDSLAPRPRVGKL